MKLALLLFLFVAGIVAVAGCSYQGPKSRPDQGTTLINTYWKLLTIDGSEVALGDRDREVHVILRPDYRVTGFGGCNTFSGTWQKEGDQLVVGPLISTKMYCSEMATERALLSALDGKVITVLNGETLLLTGSDGTELTFGAMYFQ